MPILIAFGKSLLRAIAALLVGAVAIALAMIGGAIGGGGSGGFLITAFVILFGAGWSFLPLVRESPSLAMIIGIAWLVLGYWLSQFGESHARGWMFGPWLLASCGVIGCLAFEVPRWALIRDAQQDQSGSNESDA